MVFFAQTDDEVEGIFGDLFWGGRAFSTWQVDSAACSPKWGRSVGRQDFDLKYTRLVVD